MCRCSGVWHGGFATAGEEAKRMALALRCWGGSALARVSWWDILLGRSVGGNAFCALCAL